MMEPHVAQLLLLVEDQPLLRVETEDMLVEQGFEVISSLNGSEGISELERDAARFSAVITDVRLGSGPTGWDVGHRVRELVPTMPVVYITADSADEWAANGVPGSVLISKPFVPMQLITAIATLLNASTMNDAVSKGS
ncbi:response regulator [Neorhizobium tomejilense]|uniref:response regulator n=1 Tax=Neorhizobium tomejilense TaxID=2093828 RepID=UPI001968501B|nr:response regulator [Neorhizobium tomejilense]